MADILIVSKDIKAREALKKELSSENDIHEADGIERALAIVLSKDIDIAVLREENGAFITKELRDQSDVPIIAITDGGTNGIVGAFDMGADDALSCPYDARELSKRIMSLMRRFSMTRNTEYSKCGMSINQYSRTVTYDDKTVNLPKKEFKLLMTLLSDIGKVFSRQTLMDIVWGLDCESDMRTVDVHIKRLREKLAQNERFSISTVHGKGYKVTV